MITLLGLLTAACLYKPAPQGQYRIAIMQPAAHPALEEISHAFIQTVRESLPCDCTIYNAQGNKTLMRAQIEEVVQSTYDLIFTIGAGCTQTAKEVTTKKGRSMPIVFTAVDDPVGMGVVASLTRSGNHTTGVIEQPDYTKQIEALLHAEPDIKSVLLVYDPSHGTGLERDRAELETILGRHGITLASIAVYQAHEIQQKVSATIPHYDVVMVLKDNTVVSGIDTLIKLCSRHQVILFASDLNSGHKGATYAYGVLEADFGTEAGKKALLILKEHAKPSDIPVTAVGGARLIKHEVR